MELDQFKEYIESIEEGTVFAYGISEPFSWRGSYCEVAFDITEEPSTREEVLVNIEKAYTGDFYGYKGGKYSYHGFTEVHFERDYGSWTDGGYCGTWIAKIEGSERYRSQEERLANLAFKPNQHK